MRLQRLSRKGFSLVELMIVVGLIGIGLVVIIGGLVLWGWGKASVEVVGANRAYDAVAAAHYTEPELFATYEDDYADHCKAVDDAVGYQFKATPEDGGERVTLVVCCPSTLSSRPCRLDVR